MEVNWQEEGEAYHVLQQPACSYNVPQSQFQETQYMLATSWTIKDGTSSTQNFCTKTFPLTVRSVSSFVPFQNLYIYTLIKE